MNKSGKNSSSQELQNIVAAYFHQHSIRDRGYCQECLQLCFVSFLTRFSTVSYTLNNWRLDDSFIHFSLRGNYSTTNFTHAYTNSATSDRQKKQTIVISNESSKIIQRTRQTALTSPELHWPDKYFLLLLPKRKTDFCLCTLPSIFTNSIKQLMTCGIDIIVIVDVFQ